MPLSSSSPPIFNGSFCVGVNHIHHMDHMPPITLAQFLTAVPGEESQDEEGGDGKPRTDKEHHHTHQGKNPSFGSIGEEREGKRRGRKRKRGGGNGESALELESEILSHDPLEVLGWDLMMKVLSNLDARSVALCLLVSRSWNRIASSDVLWTPKCEELWLGKAHIPRLSQTRGLSKLGAYSLSVMDGKRTRIMHDDLCDHAWEFHFTKAAPEYWRNLDPYWKGTGPPMHRYFHPDGSQTADPGDRVWGGHECCYSIVTSCFISDGKIREHYVRINRWPRLSVHRKQDWSWEMSNNLYCYSSVPDAYKEGGTGPLFLVM